MVNSKKMSKSKVAMIALAILLALSLILTATGAWFTAKAETQTQQANSYTWQISEFLNLTASNTGDVFSAHAFTKMDLDGDGEFTNDDSDPELDEVIEIDPAVVTTQDNDTTYTGGKLHPGDYIEVASGQTIKISANKNDRNFWYLIYTKSVNGQYTLYTGSDLQGNSQVQDEARLFNASTSSTMDLYQFVVTYTVTYDGTEQSEVLLMGETQPMIYNGNKWTVSTDTVKADAGDIIVVSADDLGIQIVAMQYNNQTAESAYTYLNTNHASMNVDA